jgi:ABC-2 type transport system permease protein
MLSVVLLIAGFLFSTWIAARIYRIGILLMEKRPLIKKLSGGCFIKNMIFAA